MSYLSVPCLADVSPRTLRFPTLDIRSAAVSPAVSRLELSGISVPFSRKLANGVKGSSFSLYYAKSPRFYLIEFIHLLRCVHQFAHFAFGV